MCLIKKKSKLLLSYGFRINVLFLMLRIGREVSCLLIALTCSI